MKVVFTKHALEGLSLRSIGERQVKATINKPDFKTKGRQNTTLLYKEFKDSYLKVVISEAEEEAFVITEYWIDKARAEKEAMQE